jgi:hypothetical protein
MTRIFEMGMDRITKGPRFPVNAIGDFYAGLSQHVSSSARRFS